MSGDHQDGIPRLSNVREPMRFETNTRAGKFEASGSSGTHIALVVPPGGTHVVSPDEVLSLIAMLQAARLDVMRQKQ